MPKHKTKSLNYLEKKDLAIKKQFIDNRRKRFTELLGEDCGYIESLVAAIQISPWDVHNLLEIKCPKDLIPKILL